MVKNSIVNKYFILGIVVFILLAISLGISYSYFLFTKTQDNYSIAR